MRLVVVSNRLPVVLEQNESGWRALSGSGGLVSAMAPVLRRWNGLWIGWPGATSVEESEMRSILAAHAADAGYELCPVPLDPGQIEGFYQGYSNEIIWPLFHDLQSHCNFDPDYWTHYIAVKEKFADVVLSRVEPYDFVWVNDYHLMGLGRQLRAAGIRNRTGFFLHIPFPPPDIFSKLPWRHDVLESLFHYDVLGFQTPRDRENYLDCVRKLLPTARFRRGSGPIRAELDGHAVKIGVFPIGIDYQHFAHEAARPEITGRVAALRKELLSPQIILSVDRLDYTKGIPYRLRGFHLALKRYPELHRNVTLMQVVVPSRETVPQYQELKAEIERLVTKINGEFTQPGWVPIHHVFRSVAWSELVAYYRAADVALVTPLKDGMNLVAKEYCACQVEGNGVLILSEFAGAAFQMGRDAILVNPYDHDRVAESIRLAVTLNPKKRKPAMRRLTNSVRNQDVFWWCNRFLESCGIPSRQEWPTVRAACLEHRERPVDPVMALGIPA